MKALRFKLSGKTGFFKQPDVNTYLYYTYGQIHRVALLGLLGAIRGYKGYNDKDRKDYPEFYKRLRNLNIAVVSQSQDGIFSKKLQSFNNSTGLASKEKGGTLIVDQVWLEDPSWLVYILVDKEESEKLAHYILNNKSIYTPYLGSNDHLANISEQKLIDLENKESKKIDSLFLDDDFEIKMLSKVYKYEEYLPFFLEKDTERYITKKTIASNGKIKQKNKGDFILHDIDLDKNLVFYSEEGLYEIK